MTSSNISVNRCTMALRILCLLGFLTFCHAGVLPLFNSKIVGGENAEAGEIPYQISLQMKHSSFHFCGGAILNDNYVITAAHCIIDVRAEKIKVVAGTNDLNNPKSQHDVVKIIVHENYNMSNSWNNDIALLKVKTPFVKFVTVGHVPLPSKDDVVKANDIAVVSGWGLLWINGPISTKLQRVNVFIADQEYCESIYRKIKTVHPTQVCAYDPSNQRGMCNGDSGGPLTVNGKLVGLVSWSLGCADTEYPGVYTRVVSYLDWIANNSV
ncbi:chymotrypsin-2 [Solenopsis invicta]|uniref:chymotrypsin-2 n=1 Tax=Solenopsis invicta TaxID=13686 RepID=UPI000E33DD4D|nr:chymotrypsin-2 [Solenopsis invicta]